MVDRPANRFGVPLAAALILAGSAFLRSEEDAAIALEGFPTLELPPADPHEALPAQLLLPGKEELASPEAGPAIVNFATAPQPIRATLRPWPSARSILPALAVPVPAITIRKFAFEGNRAVSDADLRTAVREFLDRPLLQEDLDQARFSLTRLYIDRGFINSGATIPDQDPAEGVLIFRITEGKVTRTFIDGNRNLRSSYFSSRLKHAGRAPLHFPSMQRTLQVLQTNPNIKRLNAELKPGSVPGEALMKVEVEENPPWSYGVDFQNHRPPSTGSEQIDLWARSTNLSGVSDTLHARYGVLSGGLDEPEFSAFDNLYLRYQRPILPDDTTIDLSAEKRDYVIIDDIFAPLNITGETWRVAAGLRRPFLRTFDNENSVQDELWLSLMLEKTHSETTLLGEPFSISPGAVNGELDLTILRFSQEWTRRTRSSVLALRSVFSLGLDALDATDLSGNLDENFLTWSASGQYLRRISKRGDLVLVNGGIQLSADPLPGQEQWTLGGRNTVRGYRENSLVRDNGIFAGIEYRYPIIDDKGGHGWKLSLAPFLDAGYGWNHDGDGEEFLASAGLGVLVEYRDWLRGDLYWGQALNDFNSQSGNLQDAGLHFRLTVAEF